MANVEMSVVKKSAVNFQGAAVFLGCLSIHLAGEPVDCCTHSVSLLTPDKDFVSEGVSHAWKVCNPRLCR
jgi:hypothetical protein